MFAAQGKKLMLNKERVERRNELLRRESILLNAQVQPEKISWESCLESSQKAASLGAGVWRLVKERFANDRVVAPAYKGFRKNEDGENLSITVCNCV